MPYFTVVLRKVFGVAGAAFVDNRVPNMRVAWPSGDWGSLPLEGGIHVRLEREKERDRVCSLTEWTLGCLSS